MMQDEDFIAADLIPSATGILECLRMLADEAVELKLDDTLLALQQAIAVCELERGHAKGSGLHAGLRTAPIAVH
jgi:hypothetical protein